MNKILKLLQLTPDQYQDMCIEAYIRWCMDFSINHENDLQKLLANTALNKYYNLEYGKCESEFLKLIAPYGKQQVCPKSARILYNECTYQMFNRFSKPLIDAAKKTDIYNDITAN